MVVPMKSLYWVYVSMLSYLSFCTILPYLVLITLSWPFSLLSMDLLPGVLLTHIFCSLFSSHIPSLLSCSLCTVGHLCMVVFLCGPLYVLLLILLKLFAAGYFSSCIRMFSSESISVCLCSCSWRYYSADICLGFICCLVCVTTLPVFVMYILYHLS